MLVVPSHNSVIIWPPPPRLQLPYTRHPLEAAAEKKKQPKQHVVNYFCGPHPGAIKKAKENLGVGAGAGVRGEYKCIKVA